MLFKLIAWILGGYYISNIISPSLIHSPNFTASVYMPGELNVLKWNPLLVSTIYIKRSALVVIYYQVHLSILSYTLMYFLVFFLSSHKFILWWQSGFMCTCVGKNQSKVCHCNLTINIDCQCLTGHNLPFRRLSIHLTVMWQLA